MVTPHQYFNLTEDGEAVGTLQQFARTFNVPRKDVVECISTDAPETIVLDPGNGEEHILIADQDNLSNLRTCTSKPRG